MFWIIIRNWKNSFIYHFLYAAYRMADKFGYEAEKSYL